MAAAQKGYLPRILGKHSFMVGSYARRHRTATESTALQRLPLLSWLRPQEETGNNQEWIRISAEDEPISNEAQLSAENGAEQDDGAQHGAPL
jgi:hypothetical protein